MSKQSEQNPSGGLSGGCHCGAVQFTLQLPSKWCAHCHCSMCRHVHGAGYVTWAGFPTTQFKLTRGQDQLHWYASSAAARRGSCKLCGSNMLFESSRWPGETHVALACINEALDRSPEANVYFDQHVNWMATDDALPAVNP